MWYLVVLSLISIFAIWYASNNICVLQNRCNYLVQGTLCRKISRIGYVGGAAYFLILFALCALRGGSIGNDTEMYILVFESLANFGKLSDSLYMEKAYQLLCLLISLISKESQAIIIGTATVIYLLTYTYYKRRSANLLIAVALFFPIAFGTSLNTIRQSIAIAILLFAYEYATRKNYKKSIACTLLACFFHKTSMIMFLYVFLMNKKISKNVASISSLVVLLIAFSGQFILGILFSFVPQYSYYLQSERVGDGRLGVLFELTKVMFIALIYYFCSKKETRRCSTKWLFLFCIWLTILGFTMNLFTRVAQFFLVLLIVPVSNEIINSNNKNRKIGLVSIGIVANVFFIIQNILRPEWNYIYPYEFFWM